MTGEAGTVGRCGDTLTTGVVYAVPRTVCALPFGHQGWHRADNGAEWSREPGVGGSRELSFAFAKAAPRITDQLRAVGWTSGTPMVVAEPSDPIGQVMARLADTRDAGHQKVLLVVGAEQPGRWVVSMVNVPAPVRYCDQCQGKGWVRVEGKVTGALCGYETVTECQACNPDGRIPWAGQVELHVEQPHHLAHQTAPGVVDPNCPACKEATP